MFPYITSSLQPDIAKEVRDILLNPPAAQPYDLFKSELIKRTSASKQKNDTKKELSDRKPSQLLRQCDNSPVTTA